MKTRLLSAWEQLSASYWFVPSLMSVGAIAASQITLWIDRAVSDEVTADIAWLYTGTPSGARELLSVIASSMLGVAGVVFSITIVVLTLASNQFGPRLLRNFMRDRGNQMTLGTFLAAFIYCLLVLRQVRGDEIGTEPFVPQVSMLVALLSALAGLGVLIYFIHHVAASIQAPHVIAGVARELHNAIDDLYPQQIGDDEADEPSPPSDLPDLDDTTAWAPVEAGRSGYVQRLDPGAIMAIACEHDLVICIDHRPGRFVQSDDTVMRAWPSHRASEQVADSLRGAFTINTQRSLAQDAGFAIEQLVEIAVRALSTGMNDPFTALQCIDFLGEAMSRLAGRCIPSPYRLDDDGHLRVIAPPADFPQLLDAAFNQMRQYAADSVDVLMGQLTALERIAFRAGRAADRQAIDAHARMIHQTALAAATTDSQRADADEAVARIAAALAHAAGASGTPLPVNFGP